MPTNTPRIVFKAILPLVGCLGLLLCTTPLVTTGCSTAPNARVAQVQTLKAVGHAAESAIELTRELYRTQRITATQARQAMDFYDQRFQPTYRVAVAAVRANLDSLASPELVGLAAELSALVASFSNTPSR
jgi:hypothetical protein